MSCEIGSGENNPLPIEETTPSEDAFSLKPVLKGMRDTDEEFVKEMSAEWVNKDLKDLSRIVERLCHETNRYLVIEDPGNPVSVITKGFKSAFAGLEHSLFFWRNKKSFDYEKEYFVILPDIKKPMKANEENGPSMGPNVISNFFFDCCGRPKVNLFQGSLQDVQSMLKLFFDFRGRHETEILQTIVNAMGKKPREENLDTDDYNKVGTALQKALNAVKKGNTLADCGLKLVSFCQTWNFDDDISVAMYPNFSVASPHFQTRVVVADDTTSCKTCFNEPELVTAYVNNGKELTKSFKDNNYGGKFVNLDVLWEKIQKMGNFDSESVPRGVSSTVSLDETSAHAFFLHAAPCVGALDSLKMAHTQAKYYNAPFTVFIAADWKTFINHGDECENTPSNFRAPIKSRINGDVYYLQKEVWKEEQKIVTKCLKEILVYLWNNKIEVLYTSIGRDDRPFEMIGDKLNHKGTEKEVMVTDPRERFIAILQGDPIGRAYLQVFENRGISMVTTMNEVLSQHHEGGEIPKISFVEMLNKYATARNGTNEKEGKSFLADVLSVAFAVGHVVDGNSFFEKKKALTTDTPTMKSDGTYTHKTPNQNPAESNEETWDQVTHLKATRPVAEPVFSCGHYVASCSANGVVKMIEMLLTAPKMNVFDHVTVWEDPGLNDADDFVATALLGKFSRNCVIEKHNWEHKFK